MKPISKKVLFFPLFWICILLFSQGAFSQDWKRSWNLFGNQNITCLMADYDSGFVFPILDNDPSLNLMKIQSNSDLLWNRTYTLNGSLLLITGMQMLSDGYLLWGAGSVDNMDENWDPLLLKLNWCMEPVWIKVFSIANMNYIDEVMPLTDSTFLIQHYGLQMDYNTFMVYNSNTDSTYSYYTVDFFVGNFSQIENEIYSCGYSYIPDVNNPIYEWGKAAFFKANLDGTLYWAKYYYPSDTVHHTLCSDIAASGNSSLIGLIREGNLNKADPNIVNGVRVFLLDTAGQIRKNVLLSDTTRNELPEFILKLSENRFVIVANFGPTVSSDYSFPKLYLIDSSLQVLETAVIDLTSLGYNIHVGEESFPRVLYKLSDSSFFLGGDLLGPQGEYDIYLIKLNADLSIAQKTASLGNYSYRCTKTIADSTIADSTIALPYPDTIVLDPNNFGLTPIPIQPMQELLSSEPIESQLINCAAYPNPVTSTLTIEVPSAGQYVVDILDLHGRLYRSFTPVWNETSTQIPFADLEEGMWFVRITESSTGKTALFRIIKNSNFK